MGKEGREKAVTEHTAPEIMESFRRRVCSEEPGIHAESLPLTAEAWESDPITPAGPHTLLLESNGDPGGVGGGGQKHGEQTKMSLFEEF